MVRPDKTDKAPAADEPENEPGYTVGYGRPPAEHRFKPGQSGNPSGGRRRKKRYLVSQEEKLKELILQEAYRMIQVREGGRTIRLMAIQAALRTAYFNAAKGDRKTFQVLATLIGPIEKENQKAKFEFLEIAHDYKIRGTEEIARCRESGRAPPDVLPHPDDILINYRTGDVEIRGPYDKREREVLANARRQYATLKKDLEETEKMLCATRSRRRREALEEVIEHLNCLLQRLRRFINDNDSVRNRVD